VSDREFIRFQLGDSRWKEYIEHAAQMINDGREKDMVPRNYWKVLGGAPLSAYRFHSLASLNVCTCLIRRFQILTTRVTMTFSLQISPTLDLARYGDIPLGQTLPFSYYMEMKINMFPRMWTSSV
jgi:hypothetical protein